MKEVPLMQQPLLTLNSRDAFALQHKEVLLGRVRMVEAARLPRIDDSKFEPEVFEVARLDVRAPRLKQAASAERLVFDPGSVSDATVNQPGDTGARPDPTSLSLAFGTSLLTAPSLGRTGVYAAV
jgi:hypothetical protein